MADPLSVAASVVGLLTAAAQVSKIIANVANKARHAPEECRRIKSEVDDIRNVLVTLQLFILNPRQASRSRTSLIMVEQVVATLAACVTTFSELDTFVTVLENDVGILDRLRWASKSKDIQGILVRLESHKSSLTLILTILTCQSQDDAESRVDKLCDLVEEMLFQNPTLKQRLAALDTGGQAADPGDTIDTRLNETSVEATDEGEDVPPAADSQPRWQRNAYGFTFEEVLMSSRAYRMVATDNSDAFSVISSAGRTASWSMLSGLSLSEISHIGIQAIPIYVTDITNKEHYDFSPGAGNAVPETTTFDGNHGLPKLSRRDRIKGLLLFRTQRPQALNREHEHTPTIFGVALATSIPYANIAISVHDEDGRASIYGYIPIVVGKTGIYLKEKGSDVEDIFATTGNPVRMSELQTIFDSPSRFGKGLVWDGFTVHDAAGILLRYLKSLPEPVIPYRHYNSFVDELGPFIDRELSPEECSKVIGLAANLCMDLPPLNRQLLVYLLDALHVFEKKSSVNKMTALRLVSSFQPSILSGPPDKMDSEAHHVSANVAILLIAHETEILEAMNGKSAESTTETPLERSQTM
ncbi:GTPase activating protein (GAP) for Rho1p [Fusarium poae]|uniref:hypothetical protein n=1 Tax=Fusarium poae TaxID=36050 RepID=UPI001CE803FF|nr:hypothetical protein FPOAC1_009959 [Fusarium poae]KAG8670537.1 hypothetical protein FPOAC1_009959 [Fusarium poae]